MLWMYGVKLAYERSYEYVKAIADYFGLEVDFVQENRVDFCWHSNYLKCPEKFFSPENFYKMRVDRFKDAVLHTSKRDRKILRLTIWLWENVHRRFLYVFT